MISSFLPCKKTLTCRKLLYYTVLFLFLWNSTFVDKKHISFFQNDLYNSDSSEEYDEEYKERLSELRRILTNYLQEGDEQGAAIY